MTRSKLEELPSFTAELEEIKSNGITTTLLQDIIAKHKKNACYNRKLYQRYKSLAEGVDIFSRKPRYDEVDPINNKINNDFFGEIIDFKVGYFAGKPFSYGYSDTSESEESTGGEQAIKEAVKAITDFTTRNNMFGVDMETTKYASIYGYAGRLFYIDPDGNERVMAVHGYETIVLTNTSISEPEYAIRYYPDKDINNNTIWTVEFYDNATVSTYRGGSLSSLELVEQRPHMFDYCPLQGIANNSECMGDAEKVMALIDAYDRTVSDNANEIEAFAHALMLFTQPVDDKVIADAQKTGALIVPQIGTSTSEPVKWLTKDINDGYTEHHLARLEDNIYRFSRTPNLGDDTWGNASGVALKFKLHGLEVKCSQFQSQMMSAAQYMWKLLASAWSKKSIAVDPLQCLADFGSRNFPLDSKANAETAQALIGAGIPKAIAWDIAVPEIDDVGYALELAKNENEEVVNLYEDIEKDEDESGNAEKFSNR